MLAPAHKWENGHAGIYRDRSHGAIYLTYMTVLALSGKGDPGFIARLIHSDDITRAPLKTGLATDTVILIYI